MAADKPQNVAGDKPILVYTTFPTVEAAEVAAGAVLDARLAACANILPGMVSLYTWNGTRERSNEVVMILKSRHGLEQRLVDTIRCNHPYDLPAIVMLPITGGDGAFLDWIAAETVQSVTTPDGSTS